MVVVMVVYDVLALGLKRCFCSSVFDCVLFVLLMSMLSGN